MEPCLDLAKRMISLHGYKPGIDMEIKFTGLRPGEKLYEELFNKGELVLKTPHPKIMKAVSSHGKEEPMPELIGSDSDLKDFEAMRGILGAKPVAAGG